MIVFPSAVATGRSYTIVEAWDRKSDPTISTTFRFNFSYCVSVETQACQNCPRSFLKVPRRLAVLRIIQFLRSRQLTLCQGSFLQSYSVRVFYSANYPLPYIARRQILSQFVANRRYSLLNAHYMPISQLDLRHVQDPSKNRQVGSHQYTAMMEDGSPPDASCGTRDLLPFDLNIVDRLKLGLHPETSQSLNGTF